jgi:hypothetical protein
MKFRSIATSSLGCALAGLLTAELFTSCARVPYETRVILEDQRVKISLQHELGSPAYSHPAKLDREDLLTILHGFSFRPMQRLPLRWFAEDNPPKPVFRADELEVLAGPLAVGLVSARPDERVHFELSAPGFNPATHRDVTAGWVAVRDVYLYFTLEYVHVQVPTHRSDPYDYNYPTPPPTPGDYLLYFEPGRFWTADSMGRSALEYREFLKTPRLGPPVGR